MTQLPERLPFTTLIITEYCCEARAGAAMEKGTTVKEPQGENYNGHEGSVDLKDICIREQMHIQGKGIVKGNCWGCKKK